MLSLIISTLAFFAAAWFINRWLDEQDIGKGMTRGALVFTLATLVSFISSAMVDWADTKIEGPQPASLASGDVTQLLKALNPPPVPLQP